MLTRRRVLKPAASTGCGMAKVRNGERKNEQDHEQDDHPNKPLLSEAGLPSPNLWRAQQRS